MRKANSISRERRIARQNTLKVLAATLVIAPGTAYLVARLGGLLPEGPPPVRMGSSLSQKPYFAQIPPLPAALKPLPVPSVTATEAAIAALQTDKALVVRSNNGNTLLSVKNYLKMMQQVETEKRGLLEDLTARAPRLRAALAGAAAVEAAAMRGSGEKAASLPGNLPAGDLSGGEVWNRLIIDFESRNPPPACAELHVSYAAHLKALRDYVRVCLQDSPANKATDRENELPASGRETSDTLRQAGERLTAETGVAGSALINLYAQTGLPALFTIETGLRL